MHNAADVKKDTRKVVMIGSPHSGKTNLLSVLTKDTFNPDHTETPGMEVASRELIVDGKSVHLQYWDAPGDIMTGKLQHFAPAYFRGASAIFFVYDVTKRESFENLQVLWDLAQPRLASVGISGKDYVTVLIGNKTDLIDARVVTAEEARQFAEGKFDLVQEVSAKHSLSVNQAFTEAAKITPVLKKLSVTHDESTSVNISKFDGKLQTLIDDLSRKKLCGCFVNKEKQSQQINGLVALQASLRVPGVNSAKAVEDAEINYPTIKHNRTADKLLKQIAASSVEITPEAANVHGM